MQRVWVGLALGALSICAGAAPVRALDPALATSQYVQAVFRAPREIPHDNVSALVQSRDGYLWVGTVDGLARFDGVRSTVFNTANTPAIRNNWIRALIEDRAGRLWIGTLGGGLVCREGETFVRYGAEGGLDADVIASLLEDRAGTIWVGTTGRGLFRFDGDRFALAPGTESLTGGNVRTLAEDRSGRLWIGTDGGAFVLDRGALAPAPAALGLGGMQVTAMTTDADGIWIGLGYGGLKKVVGDRVVAEIASDRLAFPRVWTLAVDSDGTLWIGTDGGGLDRLSRGVLTHYRQSDGLTSDYVWALREDREKGLWVGTNGGGLVRFKAGSVTTLTTYQGLPGDFVWSILRAKDGALWIGTEERGAVRFAGGEATVFDSRRGLPGSVRGLLDGEGGDVWISGDHGVHLFRNGRIVPGGPPTRAGQIAHALARDRLGTLWIGWNISGLDAWRDGKLRHWSSSNGLSGDGVSALFVASDDALWIGTTSGLDRMAHDGTITSFTTAEGLPSGYITAIFERPAGVVWAATRRGLARWADGRIQSLDAGKGLYDDALMAGVPGDDGNVWLGSNRGIFSAPFLAVQAVLGNPTARLESRALGLDDGLKSLEVNQSGSSTFREADGRIWFATRRGAAVVDPARIRPNPVPPLVAIEAVVADGRALAPGGNWRLAAGTQRLELHFTALSFHSIAGMRIEYRLEGFDPAMIEAKNDRAAVYTNLPRGHYRFHVVAANSDGVKNDAGAAVEFDIEPRLTEQLWFRALVAVAALLAIYLFYVARVRILGAQKAALERLVAERTAEVAAANERLAQLAREDGLTGVANRRAFNEAIVLETRRADRLSTPLALLMIDVDLFKRYNDRLGHPQGDACLQSVARAISAVCRRAGETVARYGGEEFAALLPGANAAEAEATAERVRAAVEELAISHPESPVAPHVTVSIGLAARDAGVAGAAGALIDAADRALYRAKQLGRNRIASETPGPRG